MISSVTRKTLYGVLILLNISVQFAGAFLGQGMHQRNNLQSSLQRSSNDPQESSSEISSSSSSSSEASGPSDNNRRQLFSYPTTAVGAFALLSNNNNPAWAANSKSRTEGYAIQKSESEWESELSDMQYYILRRGGTESPNYSILEGEDRPGTFVCAGCGTELFVSKEKFHSGTGWPSFARGLPGVEVEAVNPITANLVGAELRCKTCGGHLGDVFNDGYLFVGTPAFTSGKRYCIDGAALLFKPEEEGQPIVRGDTMKPQQLPSWFDPPKINVQS